MNIFAALRRTGFALAAGIAGLAACAFAPSSSIAKSDAPLRWRVVRVLPHDSADFTQGLALEGDRFIESTGQYGRSQLLEKDIASGSVVRARALDADYFGEGVTLFGGRIVQLTWREHATFVYDRDFRLLRKLRSEEQGWGITHDGHVLITSDGSTQLQFRDAETFSVLRTLEVREDARPLINLNELEYARGRIWANVWLSDRIVAIDPASGAVEQVLDLSGLEQRFERPANWNGDSVLNGIAYDAASDHFYVTGKCWPVIFELEVERR
ncbi:MAG TPA: glutaminyl-peptide cyclotransferase [Solimonas sp.]|nr:glutaminyl-peptide cyclotransferase [Solimonas sp.]